MPEPVLYIRGFPGSGAFEAADPAMFADLATIADLSEAELNGLSAAMKHAGGFLDTEALREKVKTVITGEKTVQAVFRALNNLEPQDVGRILDPVEHSRNAEKKSKLDDAKMVCLRRNLPALIQPYPALIRFEKARRLATLTGQRLDSADLICDIRPIFDEDGLRIEGMFPYTRLRLVATGADGLPRDFEVQLSVKQVYQLFQNTKRAKQKLDTLRTSIETWTPNALPNLPETQVPLGEIDA